MVKMCNNCRHWHFAETEEEWQCWNDNCIHEGEERDNLQPACEKWETEIDEEAESHEECKECRRWTCLESPYADI